MAAFVCARSCTYWSLCSATCVCAKTCVLLHLCVQGHVHFVAYKVMCGCIVQHTYKGFHPCCYRRSTCIFEAVCCLLQLRERLKDSKSRVWALIKICCMHGERFNCLHPCCRKKLLGLYVSIHVFKCALGGAQVPGLTVLGNHVSLLMATQRCPWVEGGGSPQGYLLLISYAS
jgi:hypothetical protein